MRDVGVHSPPLAHALASAFVEKGILSSDQLDVALKEQKRQGTSLEDCLLASNFITESALAEALSLFTGYAQANVPQTLLDPSLKELIPRETAERYTLIPLSLEKQVLRVALSDIYNLEAFDFLKTLENQTIKQVSPLLAPASDIIDAIDRYYGYDLSIRGLLQEIEAVKNSTSTDLESPTIRLVNAVLIDAIKKRASDIHFEPEGAFTRLRYRIDGLLTQIFTFHSSYWPAIVVRLKVLSEMNIAESRRPQNGRMTYYIGPREIDLRLSSHPTVYGENIVIRILDKDRSLLSLDKLGYSPLVIRSLKKVLQRPEGIIILTGPTGCGKTTSLYSLLSHISLPSLNIMTLEEPVEYKLPLIRQTDIRKTGGMDFADGVRSLLRQDPDILLIGEIRDLATAQMALRASMTGHQVFSTLHTTDALGALPRLIDLGLSPGLLTGNLLAVVAQRLLRRLCVHCKKKKEMTKGERKVLKAKSTPSFLFHAHGCSACQGTGYYGRFAVAEVLILDQGFNELFFEGASLAILRTYALRRGYIPLADETRRRVLDGETSLQEASRIVDLEEESP